MLFEKDHCIAAVHGVHLPFRDLAGSGSCRPDCSGAGPQHHPARDIPTLAALSLLALVLEVILFGENHRFWATSLIVGTVAFGVLSLCAGSVPTVLDALRVGILGGAVFLICEVLLHSILDRISSGAAGKYPRSMAVVSALLLWLAAQILMSIGI